MLGAGLRKEEAVGLMWEDVDLESGYIHVRHAKAFCHGRGQVTDQLKSKAAYRDIPLPVWLTQILSDERAKSKSPFVLAMRNGESLSASAYDRLWGIIKTRTTTDPSLLGKPTSPRHPNTVYEIGRAHV